MLLGILFVVVLVCFYVFSAPSGEDEEESENEGHGKRDDEHAKKNKHNHKADKNKEEEGEEEAEEEESPESPELGYKALDPAKPQGVPDQIEDGSFLLEALDHFSFVFNESTV